MNLVVIAESPALEKRARAFCEAHRYEFVDSVNANFDDSYIIHFSEGGTYLSVKEGRKRIRLQVQFDAGRTAHRRLYGGGKGQLIAKAVGLQSKKKSLNVVDCTAGQGSDAFVLAGLGCYVTMIERSAVAHLMLESGLVVALETSARNDQELHNVLNRMRLLFGDASKVLPQLEQTKTHSCDVIYLDPMFPARKKAALVKKEMQLFHQLIGKDEDSNKLLALAREFAKYRVVVKRPKGAPHLSGEKPTYELSGKSTRFDIYVNLSLNTE